MQFTTSKIKKTNIVFTRGRTVVALLLAIGMITGVFWWLKLVGITMAGDAFCGIEEHQHTEACTVRTLICTTDHEHGNDCYEISYTCGKIEHIHTESCYSNPKADIELATDWEQTLVDIQPNVALAEKMVAIAQTQLGYTESSKNFKIDENGRRGYTRYGEFYSNPYGDWSGMFVGFCLNYAGVSYESVPCYAGEETTRLNWVEKDLYITKEGYTAESGDILFLDIDQNGNADTMGIVTSVNGETITAILGDYQNTVAEVSFKAKDATILGYGSIEKILYRIADEAQLAWAEKTEAMIDALPSLEEIGEKLGAYEASGDTDGYATYFSEISQTSLDAYAHWEDLGILRALVKNAEQLQYYSSFWMVQTPTAGSAISIFGINKHTNGTNHPILCHTSKISSTIAGWSYSAWYAYTIDRDNSGYYVSKIDAPGNAKNTQTPPANGFIVLIYPQNTANNSWDVAVGDRVEVNFTYKGQSKSSATAYGSVTVQDNNITPIDNPVSTLDMFEINLFNYDSKINTQYTSSSEVLPGFQQEYGTIHLKNTTTSLSSGAYNYGNNITVDIDAGISGITNGATGINQVINTANTPINHKMNYNLVDGYPALADSLVAGTSVNPSLKYLFTDNPNLGVNQMNLDNNGNVVNIDGLFQIDATTGQYYFKSRQNHAQYNSSTYKFELFKEKLSPNYIMYPFGNFLPFNNINTQSTKITSINRSYFTTAQSQANIKSTNGFGDEYATLATQLSHYNRLMPTSYDYIQPIKNYFGLTEVPDINNNDRINGLKTQLSNMYNLDYDEASDFYFGMNISFDFIMPKDALTGPNHDLPLEFDFRGDDDVWVYIDGKLFLDLSGIHRHVGGRIDFTNGWVEYYGFDPQTGLANKPLVPEGTTYYTYVNESGQTVYYVPFSVFLGPVLSPQLLEQTGVDANGNPVYGTFKTYSQHNVDFYYMERGSGSSVCDIAFNLPVINKNSITVHKELTGISADVLGNPDFKFQILKPDGTPYIGANTTYHIYDDLSMTDTGRTGVTGENGVFTLKAGEIAVFPGIDERSGQYFVRELLDPSIAAQYGEIYVDGSVATKENISGSNFVGVDSPIKNINESSDTTFTFTNKVDVTKYGAIELQKLFYDYQSGIAPRDVTFNITLDDIPIPIGTIYKVTTATGTEENRTVTTTGQITFRSDERIVIPKILAGTKVTVKETSESAAGYNVNYVISADITHSVVEDPNGKYAEIQLPAGTVTNVVIGNDREGTKLTIPVNKTILYPDGTVRDYNFMLQQIVSLNDHTTIGLYIKHPLSMASGSTYFTFTLNYPTGTAAGDYYYLIYEEGATSSNGMDATRYIVKVTVTEVGGSLVATITGLYYEDGSEFTGTTPLPFTNRIVRSLTVSKTVENIFGSYAFTFKVYAEVDGVKLHGDYHCVSTSGQTIVTFENGVASFLLKDRETLTILDLPYGCEWQVTEEAAGGFYTKYAIDHGESVLGSTATGTLQNDQTVDYLNIGGYQLPETGHAGYQPYIFAGCGLMLLALVIGYALRRRERRVI